MYGTVTSIAPESRTSSCMSDQLGDDGYLHTNQPGINPTRRPAASRCSTTVGRSFGNAAIDNNALRRADFVHHSAIS
jgi:hypothetical protein